ncbi:BamA/TamA family outer membrane protein [bacterium]|nr:BamA/TamA family outer membrane protein [bacterium]MBU1989418.1 BamA/TamA family outer membrane protein [bacterium]
MKQFFVMFLMFSLPLFANNLLLTFQGNKNITERELYDSLALYKPYMYEFWKKEPAVDSKTLPLLSQTLSDYYKSRGYFHAIVTYLIRDNKVTINIEENKPIRIAHITRISELDIRSIIPFKVGDIFDAQKFNQSKKDIKLFYANHSFCDAKLNSKAWIDIQNDYAYLLYETTPNEMCYFGQISISTSHTVDEDIVKSFLYIEENEPYSTEQITQSYKSLYAQEGIAKAIIDTKELNASIVNIKVSIDEVEKPIRFQIGAGISSDEGLMGTMGVKHRNLLGNLKTLSLNTRVTQIKQTIKSNINIPLQDRNALSSELGFENENFIGYKERRVFANMLLKQRDIKHTFQEGLVFDYSNTYASEDMLLFPEGTLFVPSLMLEWGMDTRDILLDPSKGYFLRTNIMGSVQSEISHASYYKFNLTGGYILPLERSIIALKVKLGSLNLLGGEIPASYRYYSGGMYSNRGYAYRRLGPTNEQGDPTGSDSIFETTAEYRFPVYGNFKGVVFSDNTFIDNTYLPNFDKVYSSVGLGIRYRTPIGPLAIDFGFDINDPLKQYALHFHIGELF